METFLSNINPIILIIIFGFSVPGVVFTTWVAMMSVFAYLEDYRNYRKEFGLIFTIFCVILCIISWVALGLSYRGLSFHPEYTL